jgi:hypothetical protein
MTLPMHDRNGETMAAVRVQLKAFFGETQDTVQTRCLMIVKALQSLCASGDELRK